MKKRILSMLLVLVMVFTLVPFSAFADVNLSLETVTVTITQQPQSVEVNPGGSATFYVGATSTPASDMKYIWFDADELAKENVNMDSFSFKDIGKVIAAAAESTLGTGTEYTVEDAKKSMNIRCLVYSYDADSTLKLPNGFALSSTATLTVRDVPLCESHALGVNLVEIPSVDSTCAKQGNKAYFKCTECGRCYADPYGDTLTSAEACKLPKSTSHVMPLTYCPATSGTCDERSLAAHWKCSECGQLFRDEAGSIAITKFDIQGEKDPKNHVNVEFVPAKEATCCEKGHVDYWYCKDCHTYFANSSLSQTFKDKDATETAKRPANHPNELKYYPAKDATCTEKGNVQYWYCEDCHCYFANAQGTQKFESKTATEIKALGHNFEWVYIDDVNHSQKCTHDCGTETVYKHTVGTAATCTEPAVCKECGHPFGDTNPSNHANTELVGVVEATIQSEGYSGDLYCSDCHKLISQGHTTDKLCAHTDPDSGVLEHVEAVEATCNECKKPHDGNIEYWHCKECGKYWSDPALTKEITLAQTVRTIEEHYYTVNKKSYPNDNVMVQKNDAYAHWFECKFCGYQYKDTYDLHTMVETPPTCCSGHVCVLCGYDDGVRDFNNHVGETKVVGKCEPNGTEAGYTGDIVCCECNGVIRAGREYYAPCKDGGCKGHLVRIDAKAPTCYEDGTKAYYRCEKCLNIYMDTNATVPANDDNIIDPCTGHDLHPSIDSLTNDGLKAMLKASNWSGVVDGKESLKDAIIGWINGDPSVNLDRISVDDILSNIHLSDIDHCHDDNHHWLGCQRCGKTLADIRTELEDRGYYLNTKFFEIGNKEAHYGGNASCKEKATCAECGEKYGSFGPHTHNEKNKCTVCGNKIAACAAPTVTLKNNSSTGKIVISWKSVNDAKNYQVYRMTTKNGSGTKLATVSGTSYTDTSAVPGKTYYYKVRAMGNNGSTGDFSTAKSLICKCASPAVKITNLSSSGKIKLSWSAVANAAKYDVYRATSKTGTYTKLASTTATSYTNTTAKAGVTYYYKVRATSSKTTTANSAYSTIVSCTCKCARPVVTASNSATSGKVKLSWKAVDGASKYEIWRATGSSGTYTKLYTTSKTSYVNSSSKVGHTYYYKVVAVSAKKSAANSAFSTAVSRMCDCARPTVKISLSSGDPYLKWSAIEGADKYDVYRATSKNGTYTKLYTTSKTSYKNTSARSGVTYYYKVKAVSNISSSASSAYSTVVSIKAK